MAKKRFTRTENKVSVKADEAVETVPTTEAPVEVADVAREEPVEPSPVVKQEAPVATAAAKPGPVTKGRVYISDGAGGRFPV